MTPNRSPSLVLPLLVLLAGLALVFFGLSQEGCTPQARSEADVAAVDLTDAVCSPLDPLDSLEGVRIACVIAEGVEGLVGPVIASTATTIGVDTGTGETGSSSGAFSPDGAPVSSSAIVTLKLPPATAARVLRRHPLKAKEGGL